eukprot:6191619-Pleurochrysis_carterae.AAC.4
MLRRKAQADARKGSSQQKEQSIPLEETTSEHKFNEHVCSEASQQASHQPSISTVSKQKEVQLVKGYKTRPRLFEENRVVHSESDEEFTAGSCHRTLAFHGLRS